MDIDHLLYKSKIRRKIFLTLFADENRRYYINEMARIIGTTQGTCRRELNRLLSTGILKTSKLGNLCYYALNKAYPLYPEFSGIIRKTIGVEAMIRHALVDSRNIAFAFLLGPYVLQKLDMESDIDIVVVGQISENTLIGLLKDIPKITGRGINYYIYTERDFREKLNTDSFIQTIRNGFIQIAGNERALKNLLDLPVSFSEQKTS